jgi:hypothetical protein
VSGQGGGRRRVLEVTDGWLTTVGWMATAVMIIVSDVVSLKVREVPVVRLRGIAPQGVLNIRSPWRT